MGTGEFFQGREGGRGRRGGELQSCSRFMLKTPEITAGLMGQFPCMQPLPLLFTHSLLLGSA